VNKTYAL